MKIATISDVHGCYDLFPAKRAPAADLFVFAGDLTNFGFGSPEAEEMRITRDGLVWLESLGRRAPVLAIPGNHDIAFSGKEIGSIPNVTWLIGHVLTFDAGAGSGSESLTFTGVTMCNGYGWPELAEIWDFSTNDPDVERRAYLELPQVDVLVSHCPPYGVLDSIVDSRTGGRSAIGARPLNVYIAKRRPRLVICGHAHDSVGSQRIDHAGGGATLVVNTSLTWGVWDSVTGLWEPVA